MIRPVNLPLAQGCENKFNSNRNCLHVLSYFSVVEDVVKIFEVCGVLCSIEKEKYESFSNGLFFLQNAHPIRLFEFHFVRTNVSLIICHDSLGDIFTWKNTQVLTVFWLYYCIKRIKHQLKCCTKKAKKYVLGAVQSLCKHTRSKGG